MTLRMSLMFQYVAFGAVSSILIDRMTLRISLMFQYVEFTVVNALDNFR